MRSSTVRSSGTVTKQTSPADLGGGNEARSRPRLDRWTWPGLFVVAISIVLLRVQPSRMHELPAGMLTPVLALELAQTPAEVERIFGTAPAERARFETRMIRGTWIDFALLATYGLFLAGVAHELSRSGSRSARFAVLLAVAAACFDAAENWQLLGIFANLGGHYEGALATLRIVTWGKWWCLGAYFAAVAAPAWALGGFARAAAISGIVGGVASIAALPLRGIPAEIMLNGTSVGIAGFVVATYRQRIVEYQRRTARR